MIVAENVSKRFDDILAIDSVSAVIKDGSIFGLIGSNGAGKSTFLRMMAGILKPDIGSVRIDDRDIFENCEIKERFFYISDEQFYFSNVTPEGMKNFYRRFYKKFDETRFYKLLYNFGLDKDRKVNTFSKGMKKQLSVICAVSAKTDYVFCDETFDGLDPVARQAVKSLFAADMEDRGLVPVIASHNLRELEDICDHIGLLHQGGILLSKDLDEMKLGIHKLQCVFTGEFGREMLSPLEVLNYEKRGSLYSLTIRGEREEIAAAIRKLEPVFFEMLPLTLEEIFISETEVRGYDIKKLIF